MALGILPLLVGIGIEANNIRNAQQQVTNEDFADKAWHNLESDEIFPAYLSNTNTSDENPVRGWSRQGIAKESPCEEALLDDLSASVEAAGCETTLRATYADSSGSMSATVALVVLDSYESASQLSQQFSPLSDPGPVVRPVELAGTASEEWLAVAGGASVVTSVADPPYLLAVSVGSTEPTRSVGKLPSPWDSQERHERQRWSEIGADLLEDFDGSFVTRMGGDR